MDRLKFEFCRKSCPLSKPFLHTQTPAHIVAPAYDQLQHQLPFCHFESHGVLTTQVNQDCLGAVIGRIPKGEE